MDATDTRAGSSSVPHPDYYLSLNTAVLAVFAFYAIFAVSGLGTYLRSDSLLGDFSAWFLVMQDTAVLLFFTAVLFLAPHISIPLPRVLTDLTPANARGVCSGIGLLVFAVAAGGAHVVMRNYPLSVDEFMVWFDAHILLGGHLMAPLAPEWRGWAEAFQPLLMLQVPGEQVWSSLYLPMNAAIYAPFAALGAIEVGPAFVALAALAALFFAVRRIWPDRPDAALVAVVLLATSAQFLFTSMTLYAMTAHLALNLIWLCLFLRNTKWSHAGAIAAGFVATGLHQFVFHPLFVAPFVLGMLVRKRFKLAAVYTCAYAAICFFWLFYSSLALPDGVGLKGGGSLSFFLERVREQLVFLEVMVWGMPRNLARFASWQNPALLVLFLLSAVYWRRLKEPLPELLGGIALTLLAMSLLSSLQGHGWGYRYMHGVLGSMCVLAAFAWIEFADREKVKFRRMIVMCTLAALAVLPVRAWQAKSLATPYAEAWRAISESKEKFVIIDPIDVRFGADLTRNDPYLQHGPKVVVLNLVTDEMLERICESGSVAVFDRVSAERFGMMIREYDPQSNPGRASNARLRGIMKARGCQSRLIGL